MSSSQSERAHDLARLAHSLESAVTEKLIARAVHTWAAYVVAAFAGAMVMGNGLVSVYDVAIGVPIAVLSSWLWSRDTDGTAGAAIIVTAFMLAVGFLAGAV